MAGALTGRRDWPVVPASRVAVPRLAGSRYVFPNPDTGKPYVTIFYAWNTARQCAGLPDVRIHDLRHSFASILINSGRSLYEVQHLLGHTQSKTTERYAHLQRETLLKAANVVATLVGNASSQRPLDRLLGA
jgi:integrase